MRPFSLCLLKATFNIFSIIFREYNLAQIDTGDLLTSSPELSETMRNFSPSIFSQELMDQHTVVSDVCAQFSIVQQYPAHFDQLPLTDSFESAWNFNINLNSDSAGKTSWMFSTQLNKVFVKIDTHLNIYPSYDVVNVDQKLYVRAMIVYTSKNDLAEPVRKCPNHRAKSVQNNPEHILRCDLPHTQYVGDEAGKLFKDKLALLIPMSAIASNEPIKLQFTCQNSCSGMSRKYTSIVFTLENDYGECLGRKVLNFKVCSCPKRDKERDEDSPMKLLPKKRKAETNPSTSKKIAIQPTVVKQESQVGNIPLDSMPLPLPVPEVKKEPTGCVLTVALPDNDLKRRALEAIQDMVAGKMLRTGDIQSYQPYLNDIRKQIGK